MKRIIYGIILAAIAIILVSSLLNRKKEQTEQGQLTKNLQLKDDHTIYGLACEGCTDSVVYLLPNDGSDPVRYEIIDATRNKRIIGKIKIGDWIGLTVSPEDSTVATMVIDLDQLKGTWCYVVMPKLRDYDKLSKKQQARITRDMPDSVKETYLIPREYGFTLKRQFQASPVGYVRQASALEDESPVVYPVLPMYSGWHILNGQLVLTRPKDNKMMFAAMAQKDKNGKDIKPEEREMVNDTATLLYMDEDSLALMFSDRVQSYYRLSNANEANKLAREKAEKLTREANKQVQQ